ncbi:4236_t:CDS:1, partial [Cetraspora pellucida]
IPSQKDRLLQLLNGTVNPYWWEDFKREWEYVGASEEKRKEIRATKKTKRKHINTEATDSANSIDSYFTQ